MVNCSFVWYPSAFQVPNVRMKTLNVLIRLIELPDWSVLKLFLHSSRICRVLTSKASRWTLGQATKLFGCISVITIILNYFTAFFSHYFFPIKYKEWKRSFLHAYVFKQRFSKFSFNFKVKWKWLSILDSRILSKCYSILDTPGSLCKLLPIFLIIRFQ